MNKPVIFLAFANDRVDDTAYLRNLPLELNGIREALKPAVQAGLCEVVERANASISQILDVFQDEYYRNRIAIFHYGGHASSYQLLLETATGGHAHAHSEGLVAFLSRQQGLNLVFLNGCSSQNQAEELLNAGVPVVVGTSQSINDDVATQLSIRFYKALAQGSTLGTSWEEGIHEVRITKGTANMRDLFWEEASESEADHFPWSMSFRAGAEGLDTWSLPAASGNPLFGLPSPSYADLPEKPFRFLQRYTREDAAIFFGRGQYIRDLFDRATDPHAAPIILLYGQSGVGKSSMLAAGLFPRLEQVCQVVYVRRDVELGLLNTLKRALGIQDGGNATNAATNQQVAAQYEALQEQIKQLEILSQTAVGDLRVKLLDALNLMQVKATEMKAGNIRVTGNSLKEAWLAHEKAMGKPLVILLDQVEEIYTKPNKALPQERQEALAEIHALFADPKARPQGKLILSYRKEYHPEIEEALKTLRLPREHVFLKKLDYNGIIEVVKGLGSTESLRRQYRLQIEERLPEVISDDLLEDEDSPIAPILQILLTKMWLIAEKEENRTFSISKYQELKNNGILMGDFFQEQMEKLKAWNISVEESGLALDILNFHTTEMGTAGTHTWDELQQRYQNHSDLLESLVQKFKELYLLTDAGSSSGLAHDTLAPLIQNQFRKSDKPGHRAARILESKKVEFERDRANLLDTTDLQLVEEGKDGMPNWDELEIELVAKSKERRKKMEASKRRIKRLGIATTVLITLLAFFSFFQWRRAVDQAELATKRAITNELRRTQLELDLQRNYQYPMIGVELQRKYQLYPNNPFMANLVYKFMLECGASKERVNGDYTEAFNSSNQDQISSLNSGDPPMTKVLFSRNPKWEVSISTFTAVKAQNLKTGEENEFTVVVADLGTFTSFSIHPTKDLVLVVCSDQSIRLLDLTGEIIWRQNQQEGIKSAGFEANGSGFLVKYSSGELVRYNMNVQELVDNSTKCWGNGPI